MTPNDEVLNSWKEVASYLGRGVRTVQRWERELGLPVRRPRGKSRSAVIAFKTELDKWLRQAPAEQLQHQHAAEPDSMPKIPKLNHERQSQLQENTAILINKATALLSCSSGLNEQLNSLRANLERTLQLTASRMKRDIKWGRTVTPQMPDTQSAPATKPADKRANAG